MNQINRRERHLSFYSMYTIETNTDAMAPSLFNVNKAGAMHMHRRNIQSNPIQVKVQYHRKTGQSQVKGICTKQQTRKEVRPRIRIRTEQNKSSSQWNQSR